MSSKFDAILSRTAESIEETKLLPAGSYLATVKSFLPVESKKKQTPGLEFVFQLESAGEDVDPAELEAAGGLVTKSRGPRELRRTYFFIADQDSFGIALKRALESAGVADKPYSEIIDSELLIGRAVLLSFVHQTYEDESVSPDSADRMKTRGEVDRVVFQG